MPTSPVSTPRHRRSWYPRLMDWLWHGPLTRDLYPRPHPTHLQSFLALLADLRCSARALLLPGALPTRSCEPQGQRLRPHPSPPGASTEAGATRSSPACSAAVPGGSWGGGSGAGGSRRTPERRVERERLPRRTQTTAARLQSSESEAH